MSPGVVPLSDAIVVHCSPCVRLSAALWGLQLSLITLFAGTSEACGEKGTLKKDVQKEDRKAVAGF